MNQRTITLTILISIVVVLAGVIYYFSTIDNSGQSSTSDPGASRQSVDQPVQPTTTQIASSVPDLTTYTNEKWGFKVGYPSGYEVKIDIEKTTELDLSIRKIGDPEEAKNNDGVCANCTLRLQILREFIGDSKDDDGDFKTPEDWVEFQKSIGSNYSKTTLAGRTAYTISDPLGRKTYLIFVENGLMYDRYDIDIKENDNNANAIVQTFRTIK